LALFLLCFKFEVRSNQSPILKIQQQKHKWVYIIKSKRLINEICENLCVQTSKDTTIDLGITILLTFILPKIIASLWGNWVNVKNYCQNMFITMGRWNFNFLQMLDFKSFKFEKHLSSFTHPKTRTLAILASLKYLNNLWHNNIKNKMIRHNQVTRLKSKGIFIAFNV
jgi:hypothetical protein